MLRWLFKKYAMLQRACRLPAGVRPKLRKGAVKQGILQYKTIFLKKSGCFFTISSLLGFIHRIALRCVFEDAASVAQLAV